jgi:error-prone DNA polymerase
MQNGNYLSIQQLIDRVPLINKKEIRALSMSGALSFENVHRRQALWQSELAIKPNGELFQEITDNQHDFSFIKKMDELESIETDLITTGLSVGKHPMAFIREQLTIKNVLSASQTLNLKKKDVVTVAGAVIVKQRPGSAHKVLFITMEDETGYSNFIVMPDVFDKFRNIIMQNSYLLIKGIAEEGSLIKGLYFESINDFMSKVVSHDFH